jgi:hypothetical protein
MHSPFASKRYHFSKFKEAVLHGLEKMKKVEDSICPVCAGLIFV